MASETGESAHEIWENTEEKKPQELCITHTLSVKYCAKHLICNITSDPFKNLFREEQCYSHFTGEKAEAISISFS